MVDVANKVPKFEQTVFRPPSSNLLAPTADFVLHSVAKAFEERKPMTWRIEGLLPEVGVTCFYGDPGSKKSYYAIWQSIKVAQGEKCLGMDTKACNVLFVDEESGIDRMLDRYAKAIVGAAAPKDLPIYFTTMVGFAFTKPGDIERLDRAIATTKAKLVYVDALVETLGSGDENGSRDTAIYMTMLRRVAEKHRCCFVIIHHSNKSGGYRGSGAIKGGVDTMVCVESDAKSPHVMFKVEKLRDAEEYEFYGTCSWDNDNNTFTMTESGKTSKGKFTPAMQAITAHLHAHGVSTTSAIKNACDKYSHETIKKALADLKHDGVIVRTDNGGRGVEASYDLVQNMAATL